MLHISEDTIGKQAQSIFSLVKNGENGTGICYPTAKIGYNLLRFTSSKTILRKYLGLLYRRIAFCIITLSPTHTKNLFLENVYSQLHANGISLPSNNLSFSQMCEETIQQGKEPYFFILNTNVVSKGSLNTILSLVHQTISSSPRVKGIIFFEQNIYRNEIFSILSPHHLFLQNILYLPLLSEKEAGDFVNNVAKEFHITLSSAFKKNLINTLGGSMWLLKGALRYMRDSHARALEQVIHAPIVKMRLQILFDTLSSEEKKNLATLVYHPQEKVDPQIKEYFLRIGLLKEEKDLYYLTIPLLSSFIEKIYQAHSLEFDGDNHLFFEDKEISPHFSPFEKKALLFLLKNQGKIVSREMLAEGIWGDSWAEKYSDWALDKVISRIRKNLQQIGLPSTIIMTKKRQGFIIE